MSLSILYSNQDCIEEALLPTLRTLMSAPPTSPLICVDIKDVGLFIIQGIAKTIRSKDYLSHLHNQHFL